MPPRSLRSRAAPLTSPSAAPTASATRPRRGTTNQSPPSAVIQRSSPEETRQSIHLTVKADPGKLRKATSGSVSKSTARTAVTPRNIVSGKRASRNSRVVREVDSDDEEDEDEDDEPEAMDVDDDEDDDDEEDDDEDAEGEEDDEVDAEGEEDEDMEDLPAPPPPRVVVPSKEHAHINPVRNTKAHASVETKEVSMADDDDDDELSELDSELEGDEEDAEGEDEDAEGEDDEEETVARIGDDDEDEDMDSDDGTPGSETPDLSKMTRRQRARVAEDSDGALISLSNEAQKKKHLTAEEHAMRRAEMARRRKNLSEKRNEEEKMDTINRLLKKQPPKRGKRAIQDANESGQEDEGEVEKANPLYVRYTQTVNGTWMAVPEEWLSSPVGSVFAGPLAKPSHRPFGGRMVEEVV